VIVKLLPYPTNIDILENFKKLKYDEYLEIYRKEKTDEIMENLGKYAEDAALYSLFKSMKESNIAVLKKLSFSGDYINDKQHSIYANRKAFLVFEDEKLKKAVTTKIKYESFVEFCKVNTDEISGLLLNFLKINI